MNNRLGDLPVWAKDPIDDEEDEKGQENAEPAPVHQDKKQVNKEIFFTAVEQIKKEITHIQQATADIEKINEQAQKATTTEKEQELSKRLRNVIDGTNKKAKAAKNLLGELKTENEELKNKGEIAPSDLR
jgi:hypothetical protein